ncbi:MAG TPA: T9SS type A sorting domain-containing protein, partial [Acidimicrobiia bacterium]|nr:T9SS type A sorting domain-containing protein [Acidimicrobiia bacterium]
LVSPTTNPVALNYVTPTATQNIVSDYNLFWVPNGYVGQLTNLSSQGFTLPSGPRMRTLNQWRAYTGLDRNSVEGNITAEFVSTTPGSEDLHLRPQTVGSIAGNRGAAITGLTTDIDRESRGGAAVRGRFDIGADEFTGVVRNNDLLAEDVMTPAGYRASTGQFSDAEYIMTDSLVPLAARLRNVGGMPITTNAVTMTVSYINPSNGSAVQVRRSTQNAAADVANASDVNFGAFMPMTLRELGLTDAFYGNNPNVSPIYRIAISSGTDDNAGNNTYTKDVRFYLQRSTREVLVSVEKYMAAGTDAVTLSNRLNSDSLMAALRNINWERADGAGLEDFDLFERDKWPAENLDFRAWDLVIWEQGSEAEGLRPEERNAIRMMLNTGNAFNRKNLILAGQDVARIHDVALTNVNGNVADQDFVRNVLRAQYLRGTTPADYSNRRIRGVTITPGKFEELERTGVAGDAAPMPAVVRTTGGQGIATLSHAYVDQTVQGDSGAGVAAAATVYNSVYYGFDWRHAGRFNFELAQSGGRRLLLGALDFIDQYGGILPINLVEFDAYQAGTQVNVTWETARETEISSMEIERAEVISNDAGESLGSFATIDRVAPKGTASSGARYVVNDRNVRVGRVYVYRLVSVNLEGVRTAEQDARVAITGSSVSGYDLTVLPNPVRESGSVAWRAPRGEKLTVELFNVEGQRVATLASDVESAGEGVVAVDASALASGSYTVRLRSESGVTTTATLTVVK